MSLAKTIFFPLMTPSAIQEAEHSHHYQNRNECPDHLTHPLAKVNKTIHSEPLRTQLEHRVGKESLAVFFEYAEDQRLERISQGLASLAESRLHNSPEQFFIAAEALPVVPCEPDYRRMHFRRRIECSWPNPEKIFYVIPSLKKYRKDSIYLGSRLLGNALCDFFLHHRHNREVYDLLQIFHYEVAD